MAQIANRLTQLTIKFISLVAAGANRRVLLAKADGSFKLVAEIRKLNEERHEATSVVYPIGEVDTQGDYMTEADFDEAMAEFMKSGRVAAGVAADVDHDERATEDFFVEAWKIREGDPLFPTDVGAWAVTRKIVDEKRWQLVKSGEYRAFSFGGVAMRIPDQVVTKDDEAAAPAVNGKPEEESTMKMDEKARKGLMESFGEWLEKTFGGAPETEVEPVEEVVEPTVEETVEAAKAELAAAHELAMKEAVEAHAAETAELQEALKAVQTEHAEKVAALEAEIEALKQVAPESIRGEHQTETQTEATGGLFAGRVA